MAKFIATAILLVFLALLCLGGYLGSKHLLQLPFRSTNDALHEAESPFTLDFLVPAGFYIDEKITVGEMIQQRLRKKEAFYQKWHRMAVEFIPSKYRFYADIGLYLFWSFLFMTFFRVFTWFRYSRALTVSLLLGGIVYYFMPDFTLRRRDDLAFVFFPVALIVFSMILKRRRRRRVAAS